MKPSNTPERRRERVQRHRRRKRKQAWIDDINKIAAHGEFSSFLDRALETGIRPKPYLRLVENRATEPQLDLDYWEVATGEWLQELSRAKRLATQAMRAELGDPSGHSTEFGGDASRYLLEWRISDSDVALRLQLQLSRETDVGGLEDQVELWTLARRANRNTKRRRLKLLDGGQKEFDIAEAASKVREITVTRALRLLYVPRLMLQSARVYDLWGDIKHIRGKGRYHWDAQPLHLGEVSKEEGNVNRAIFKAPIPGSIPDHDPFRPSWWADQGSDTCPGTWRSAAHPRDWRDDEAGSLVRRTAPWIKIGLSWTSPKQLKRQDEQTRALVQRRIDRVETVIRELQALARAAGRVYTPPAPKKPAKYFGSHKARPIDRWQDRAECSGGVEVTDERHLYVPPLPKRPVKFVDPVWRDRVDYPPKSDQCRRLTHEVERPPIPAGLPQLLELSKLTRKPVDELAKMNYRHPPAITPFVRGHMARQRIHRLRHWRWGNKAHWADRVRSDRGHGFLCEATHGPGGLDRSFGADLGVLHPRADDGGGRHLWA